MLALSTNFEMRQSCIWKNLQLLNTCAAVLVDSPGILCTFSGHSPTILRTFSDYSPSILRTFSGHSPTILWTFSRHSAFSKNLRSPNIIRFSDILRSHDIILSLDNFGQYHKLKVSNLLCNRTG